MNIEQIRKDLLNLFPEFKKSENFIDELIEVSALMEVPAGTTFIETGDYIKVIPFLISGLIKIYREDEDGNEILLYYINNGESCVISITSSLRNEKSSIKALVVEDCIVFAVPNDKFEYLLSKYNLLHTFTYDLFSSKYNQLLKSIDVLAFSDMRSRVLHYLKNVSEATGNIELENLTHKRIAEDLSTSREVISRLLSSLQKAGKISLSNKKITLNPNS